MIRGFAFALALLALVPTGASASEVRVHTLPGDKAFPESIGADGRSGYYYTGSLIDGTVYRGTLMDAAATVFLPAGSDGRTNVAGVKVDDRSRIWVADAFNGRVLVYSERGQLLHTFLLTGPGQPTVNDLVFVRGLAYVTDSSRPFIYRVGLDDADRPGTTSVAPWLDVSPTVIYRTGVGPFGVNLNGIVASGDGETLLAVQTNTGLLFRVDTDTRTIKAIDVRGHDLQFGDGLLRLGDDLYVARNAANQIVKLSIGHGWRSVTTESTMSNPAFAFPTALIELRGHLLITNAQLNAAADPRLPFTVLDFARGGD